MKDYEQFKRSNKFLTSLIILALLTSSFSYIWYKYYLKSMMFPFKQRGNWLLIVVYFILLLFFSRIYGALRIGYLRKSNVIYSQALTILCVHAVMYLQICLISRKIENVVPMLVLTVADFAIIVMWAFVSHAIFSKLYPPRKLVIVYGSRQATELVSKMSRRDDKYRICYSIGIDSGMDEIKEVIKSFEGVIICDVPSKKRNDLLKYCFENSIRTYITPKLSDIIIRGADNINLFDTPLLLCRNYGLTFEERFFKRLVDLIISSVALLIFSPIMLIIAAAIKLYDGGPVFFKQERCTLNGKLFNICKFRSMIVDAEKGGKSIPATDNDPRITPVGKVIRKLRVDELPQLFNIFSGNMSIVGPRPERTEHVEKYCVEIPEFKYRLKVKGGLTGYAQVIGKYNTSAYDKLRLDLMYIENYSLLLDLKLILMTVKILFVKESTEGFDQKDTPQVLQEDSDNTSDENN